MAVAGTTKKKASTKTEYDESISVSEVSAKIMKSKTYRAVKKDLTEQIIKAGADTPVFLSLIETYMDFYLTKELCALDIKKRGVYIEYQNGYTQSGTTDNPSIDKMVKANTQMCKILATLKISVKQTTVGEDKEAEVDEL